MASFVTNSRMRSLNRNALLCSHILLFALFGCSEGADSHVTVEVRYQVTGEVVPNGQFLATQEVLLRTLVLPRVVDRLKLGDVWGVEKDEALIRLRNLITIARDPAKGSNLVHINMERSELLDLVTDAICFHTSVFTENISYPLNVIETAERDPRLGIVGLDESLGDQAVPVDVAIFVIEEVNGLESRRRWSENEMGPRTEWGRTGADGDAH